MKLAAGIVVSATLLATLCGVLFSTLYPWVEIDAGLVTLFAMLGLATSLAVAGIWKFFFPKKDRGKTS